MLHYAVVACLERLYSVVARLESLLYASISVVALDYATVWAHRSSRSPSTPPPLVLLAYTCLLYASVPL